MSIVPGDEYFSSDDYMSSNEESCITFFRELFTIEDLKKLIREFDPLNVERRTLTTPTKRANFDKSKGNRKTLYEILNIENENSPDKLSNNLYILVGPNFLYEVRGAEPNDLNSRSFRYELLKKSIEKNRFNFKDVNKTIESITGIGLQNLEELLKKHKKLEIGMFDGKKKSANTGQRWLPKLLLLLSNELPTETIERPAQSENKPREIEVIEPIRDLKPLHDYQLYAGKIIRDILGNDKGTNKRRLFSIPTGAGKTRLVCESLIDWINAGKKSNDENMQKTKYLIWIAQSRELCEQAISQFKEIYSKNGISTLDIIRFYGDNNNTLDSILRNPPKNYGVIVGTINKFYGVVKNKPKLEKNVDSENPNDEKHYKKRRIPELFYNERAFIELRKKTSCITVDEAHKGITGMYTSVLRGFGFNFAFNTKEEKLNERGIALVGLTATAFRGTGTEKSQDATLVSPFMGNVTVKVPNQLNFNIKTPALCDVCKDELPINETINQSTSNPKLLWHKDCIRYSSDTKKLYSRFSNPIIPNIHNFVENTHPIAIITCNKQFFANDPIRISGEKSFDPQGGELEYSWEIEKFPELIEVFNIAKHTNVKSSFIGESFLTELTQPGKYEITLTVKSLNSQKQLENSDVEKSFSTKTIEILPEIITEESNQMTTLIQNLIDRDILSIVYHSITKSNTKYSVSGDTTAKRQTDLLTKVAKDQERNKKIINTIKYLLTKPEYKRKKILVFSCDIAHARFLAMWLKMIGISGDYVDSKLSASRNITKINKFRKKSDENGQVLINTNMLTTGFDVPDVDCIIMGRPVMSTVEYTQMIGRGMRGTRMGGTKYVWLIDFDDQVQRNEVMSSQFIRLGWKSMAFDTNDNPIWKRLEDYEYDDDRNLLNLNAITETKEDSENVYVSEDHENDELTPAQVKADYKKRQADRALNSRSSHESTVNDTEGVPFLTASKSNTLKNSWIEFINLEKTNPIALEFIKFIVTNANGRTALDIETIIDLRKIVKRILGYQTNMNNAQINLIYSNYDTNTKNILQEMFDNVRVKMEKFGLMKFQTDTIIMILQPIEEKEKIIKLCDLYIPSLDITKNISYQTELNKPKPSMDVQLEEEFKRLTYDVLGFIPGDKHFQEKVSPKLWEFLIKRHKSYFAWQDTIVNFAAHVHRIQKRSEYLNLVIDIINQKKISPTRDMLESVIPDFDVVIIDNFFRIDTFFIMVRNIFESYKKTPKIVNFTKLELDYEFVKSINDYEPKTEEILRHSKVGIGWYMKYCGNIANFVQIYESDREIRVNLEMLKSKFLEMKSALKRIPHEKEMSAYSNYDQIIEDKSHSYWFNDYSDFLKFLGEDILNTKKPLDESTSSKTDIIKDDTAYLKKNGLRDLCDKILCEGEFKYEINFGSVLEFLKILNPQNTQMIINIWNDKKKNFNPNDCS